MLGSNDGRRSVSRGHWRSSRVWFSDCCSYCRHPGLMERLGIPQKESKEAEELKPKGSLLQCWVRDRCFCFILANVGRSFRTGKASRGNKTPECGFLIVLYSYHHYPPLVTGGSTETVEFDFGLDVETVEAGSAKWVECLSSAFVQTRLHIQIFSMYVNGLLTIHCAMNMCVSLRLKQHTDLPRCSICIAV